MNFLKGFGAFLDYKYWINPQPVPLGPSLVYGILIFFAWFLLVALVLYVLARGLRRQDSLKSGLLYRFAKPFSTFGITGLLLLFFAFEQAYILSMRLWVLVLLVWFLIRLGFVIAYAVRDYPKAKANVAEKARLEKWLPGKGK